MPDASRRSGLPDLPWWWGKLVLFGTFLVVLIVLFRSAWQSDDAYITYRCIDNVLDGHGLTYNPGERVQAFTHPLWMMVQLVGVAVSGEVYFTGILLGALFTLATLWLLATRVCRNPFQFALATLALLSSSAWIDYATSGLENPLSHFLLVLFLIEWLNQRRLPCLSLWAGLLVLNRMDLLLMVAPALFVAWWPQRSLRSVGKVILGFLPFILWEVFALFYYGFPFPNTAYAKLNTHLPSGELWERGLHYLDTTLLFDLPTLALPVLGIVAGIWGRSHRLLPPALGILFYLLYIVRIGGDFMMGRFLTVGVVVAVVLLLETMHRWPGTWNRSVAVGLAGLLIGVALIQWPASVITGRWYDGRDAKITDGGVADERAFYYFQTGLLNVLAEPDRPLHTWTTDGEGLRERNENYFVAGSMGFLGYAAGPTMYIIDGLALTDPLLARLPPVHNPLWRPGHLQRAIPEGYLEGMPHDENRVLEPDLNRLNEDLRLITRGPLWSTERFKAIWRLNTGGAKLDNLDRFKFPVRQERGMEYPLKPGESLPDDLSKDIPMNNYRGVRLKLEPFGPVPVIQVTLQRPYHYVIAYRSGEDFFRADYVNSDGSTGAVLEDDDRMTYTMDLRGEWEPRSGDELLIYGLWVYGRHTLHGIRLGEIPNEVNPVSRGAPY